MNKIPVSSIKNPLHFLALGFGSGLAPKAPGTFGTLAAIPLYLLMQPLSLTNYLILVTIVSVAGIYICGESARKLGVHDHPAIVWDEFAGYLITMIAAPPGWIWVLVGFGLFRLFDIWKPWPIRYFDKQVKGGLGIMIDDIIAGLFSLLILQLLAYSANYVN